MRSYHPAFKPKISIYFKESRKEFIDSFNYIGTKDNRYSVACYSRSRTSLEYPRKRNIIDI